MEQLGFIGLGIMGEAMGKRLLSQTTSPFYIYDSNPEQMGCFKDTRAVAVGSISEIADKATHIFIMVPGNDHVRSVIGDLLPNLKKGTFVIDMSTISPNVSRELADQVKSSGAQMIDAPVVKSQPAAVTGELGIYVGGEKNDFQSCKSLLEHLGSNVIHMGPNSSGLVMKLCHNMLVAQIQNGVNEMLLLAKSADLNSNDVIKAVSYGGGQCFYLDAKGESLLKGDFEAKFPLEHMNKDLGLTADLAASLDLDLPGVARVRSVYEQAMADELGRLDFSATYKTLEKMLGKK